MGLKKNTNFEKFPKIETGCNCLELSNIRRILFDLDSLQSFITIQVFAGNPESKNCQKLP